MKRAKQSPSAIILITAVFVSILAAVRSFGAEVGGKPEKSDIVVTYAQPSGAFAPIWVAYEAGLFKKYGLNATLQLLTPQVSAQAVVSEEADLPSPPPLPGSARESAASRWGRSRCASAFAGPSFSAPP